MSKKKATAVIDAGGIDFQATRTAAEVIKQSALARRLGVSPTLVQNVLNGSYPYMGSDKAQQVLRSLDALGKLVYRKAA